ncbi:MAG: alpha/beta hydrolase [Candidatus Kariarchaeaceae archaeon]|jgi:carboxylesterase
MKNRQLVEEVGSFEKVPILKREPFFQSTRNVILREARLLFSALNSAFGDSLLLSSRLFWPKSVDRAIRPQAQWFEIKPENPNGIGLLLCHGFASSPEMFAEIAPKLATKGYYVRVIRLSGHGTTPGHLAQTSGVDWFATVVWHYRELTKEVERTFFIGHSLGGTLGLLLSTIYPIETVVALCAPIDLYIPPARFVRQASLFVKYWPRSKKKQEFIKEKGIQTYLKTPLYAIAGIFEVGSVLRKRANKLTSPVLYVRAGLDHKNLLDQDEKFKLHFPNTSTTFKEAKNSPHTILYGPEKDLVTTWIIEWCDSKK